MAIVAILIGREGSKGFPGKNTYPLLGRPMMVYPLLAALHTPEIGKLCVSTDSEEIASAAGGFGAELIRRPANLCTDAALGEEVFQHAYAAIRDRQAAEGETIELAVLLMCNAATILAETLSEGIRVLRENPSLDSAVTVSRYNMWSPLRARRVNGNGTLEAFVPIETFGDPSRLNCDRDSQGDVWFADMGASIVRPSCLEDPRRGLLPQRWMGRAIHPLKQWGGLDVDYEWQIPQAEFWLRANGFSETRTPYDGERSHAGERSLGASRARPLDHLARIRRVMNGRPKSAGIVRLDKNEPNYSFPAGVLDRMKDLLTADAVRSYPDCEDLKEKIVGSSLIGAMALRPSQLLLTAGADGAIRLAFEAYVSPGDTVAFLDPTYAMVEVYCDVSKAARMPIPHGSDLRVEVETIERAIDLNPRLLVLANPNSPTGASFGKEEVVALVRRARDRGVVVLADEAYFLFSSETVLAEVRRYENLLVCRSFSKALGMPFLRLGFLAFHESVARSISALRPLYENHGVAVRWGAFILDHPDLVQRGVSEVLEGKRYLEAEACRLGLRSFPTPANFSVLQVGKDRRETLARRLLERGFRVKADFARAPLDAHIRVSSAPLPVMEKFVRALRDGLGGCA